MDDNKKELKQIYKESYDAAKEILSAAKLEKGALFVVGCSTSEVGGEKIGSTSNPELADSIFKGIYKAVKEQEVYLAAQCCEHLNRALIIEKEAADKFFYDWVNAVPHPKAGGSFAAMAWNYMNAPVAVEHIRADAGMDIGDTLIGMHLRDVAVPVRINIKKIGSAHVVCARTRPKFIGGSRANYNEALL